MQVLADIKNDLSLLTSRIPARVRSAHLLISLKINHGLIHFHYWRFTGFISQIAIQQRKNRHCSPLSLQFQFYRLLPSNEIVKQIAVDIVSYYNKYPTYKINRKP